MWMSPSWKRPERRAKIRKRPPHDIAPSLFQELTTTTDPVTARLPKSPRNRLHTEPCSNVGSLIPNLVYFLETVLMLPKGRSW